MDRNSLIFCTMSLVVSLVVAAFGVPFASAPSEVLARYRTPVSPDALPAIDVKGYGSIAVSDLVGFYIENPPASKNPAATTEREVHFEGC